MNEMIINTPEKMDAMKVTDTASAADLANNDTFIRRVRVLGCKSSIAVCAEDVGENITQHNLRIAYANRFLLDSERGAIVLAWGVVAGGLITAESTDSDIEFTINSIFDAFAGVAPATVA